MSKYNTRLGDIGMLEHIEDKITPEHFEHKLYASSTTEAHFNRIKVPTEVNAIRSYTSGSKDVNNALWKNKADGTNIEEHLVKNINEIHTGLDTSNPPTDDMTVYSGVRRNPQEMTKESGGLLHHPAFISTSFNPSNALSFASPTNNNEVHVLKIKIRKGQRVGGYLGDRSNIPSEQEYLIKSNQMLHIHPEPDRHEVKRGDGSVGSTVFIHHAIIMDPHEYEHLGEHAEVKKHKEMSTLINTSDESKKYVDDYMSNRFGQILGDDKHLLSTHKLSPTHIDKALENPDLHADISRHQELQPHHIDKLLSSSAENKDDVFVNLARQKNLTPDHVEHLLKKDDYNVNERLLHNKSIKLEPHHIDNLINGMHDVAYHHDLTPDHIDHLIKHRAELSTLSSRDDLLPHHIDGLIKNTKSYIVDSTTLNLSTNPHLTDKHIDKLIDTTSMDSVINSNLARHPNLSSDNIDKLIDTKDTKAIRALSFRKDLTTNHISRIIDNSDGYTNPTVLRNLNNNYKIGHDVVKKVLNNHKSYTHGLLDHIVHKQSGGDISPFKDTEYVQNHYKPLKESFSNLIVCRYW